MGAPEKSPNHALPRYQLSLPAPGDLPPVSTTPYPTLVENKSHPQGFRQFPGPLCSHHPRGLQTPASGGAIAIPHHVNTDGKAGSFLSFPKEFSLTQNLHRYRSLWPEGLWAEGSSWNKGGLAAQTPTLLVLRASPASQAAASFRPSEAPHPPSFRFPPTT